MLADVCNYSALTAWMEISVEQGAWATNTLLNSYFGAMTSCIRRHGGDVLKFAGDALLVCWEIPGGSGGSDAPSAEDATAGPGPPDALASTAAGERALAAVRCARELAVRQRATPFFTPLSFCAGDHDLLVA